MLSSAEQLRFVQYQLNYEFRDISRLVPCFKAAHRSDLDGIAEDGNRGLARVGVKIIDLVEKRHFPEVGEESRGRTKEHMLKTDRADNLQDFALKRSDWMRSKRMRAAACDQLGFTSLIATSVRQGNVTPSEKVRAFAVGAIVAAVFDDLCDQKEDTASVLEKIRDLLGLLAYVHYWEMR